MATRNATAHLTNAQSPALLHLYDAQCKRHGNSRTGYFLPSRAPHTPLSCVGYTAATMHSLARAGLLRVLAREPGDGWRCVLTAAGMRLARKRHRELEAWMDEMCRKGLARRSL